MSKCKNTIINELVSTAADIIESKVEFNELVAQQFEEKGDELRVKRLREENRKSLDAIQHIRENAGCWA